MYPENNGGEVGGNSLKRGVKYESGILVIFSTIIDIIATSRYRSSVNSHLLPGSAGSSFC